jgi:membrane associated rhomboid family serine protease
LVLPVHDINPTRRTPWVTRLLLVVNVVAFVLSPLAVAPLLGEGSPRAICSQVAFFDEYAAKPAEVITNDAEDQVATGAVGQAPNGQPGCVTGSPEYDKQPALSVLTAMFLHGGWLHLLGNLLFLFVFGNNVEDRLGRLRFLAFYLACGYAATYGFALFPRARVWSLLTFFFFFPVRLPAWLVLGSWFVLQYLYTRGAGLSGTTDTAYLAHVIGFVVGALLVWRMRGTGRPRPTADPRWGPYARR